MRDVDPNRFVEILLGCTERGMEVPFVICTASSNGSVTCIRITGEPGNLDLLAEHYEPDGFIAPIHFMVLDQTGKAVLVNWTAEGALTFH
jgi:hypothetical protein